MNRIERIRNILKPLKPHMLDVVDESASHKGHSGFISEDSFTHITIRISSESVIGKNIIEKHRYINSLLKEEFANGMHALSIKLIN